MAPPAAQGAAIGAGRARLPVAAGRLGDQTPAERFFSTSAGRIASRIVLVALLLLLWEYAPVARATRFWMSSPSAILGTLWGWMFDGTIWAHLGSTLLVMSEGYVVGCVTGIGLGFVLGFFPRLSRVLAPVLASFYALPKIALAPLFVILLGVDNASKVALVAVTVFFLVLTSTIEGVREVDRDMVSALSVMGATRTEIVRKVLIWAALPWIFTGMRIAVRYAFTATLLAELIAANRGLGFLIELNSGNFNTTGAYAAIVVIIICSVLLTELLSRLESRMLHWTR
jgi:NitT/TauT family transport system permease protein